MAADDTVWGTALDFTLPQFPGKGARWWGGRAAFIHGGRTVTYREFDVRTRQLVSVLRDAGLGPGARIGILSGDSPAYYELFFACAQIGAVLTPLNHRLAPREVEYQIKDASMTHVVLDRAYEELARNSGLTELRHWWLDDSYQSAIADAPAAELVADVDESRSVVQMYTSGTTGFAKGCMQSLGAWRASAVNFALGLQLPRFARVLSAAPMFHAFGFGLGLSHLVVGGSLVIGETGTNEDYWNAVETYAPHTTLVPRGLPSGDGDRGSVKVVVNQAGLYRPVIGRLVAHTLPEARIIGVYGLTEATNIVITSSAEEEIARPGTMGQPLPGIDARVVDRNGADVEPGRTGEIVVRGRQMCSGYWNNASATEDLFRDGWLHTGDLATMDADGWLYFADRAKDMIKSGGENVYSAEVERVLGSHPKVADVAVFGVPDKKWTEAVKAVVVPFPGTTLDAAELDRYCRDNIARYKRPRWYEIVAEIPRNPTGKVLKASLRNEHDPSTAIRLQEPS